MALLSHKRNNFPAFNCNEPPQPEPEKTEDPQNEKQHEETESTDQTHNGMQISLPASKTLY
jgi:hypothetical protein